VAGFLSNGLRRAKLPFGDIGGGGATEEAA
jgi:hypothetical protein